jgi:putative nucleotidyltransferase with HDIG domain
LATGSVQLLDTEFVTTFDKPAFIHCQFDTFELSGAQHLLLVMTEISEISAARKAIEQRVEELEAIRQVSEKMRVFDNVDEMLPSLMDTALKVLDLEAGSIWLHDPATDLLTVRVSRGYGPPGGDQLAIPAERPGTGLAGMVFANNQAHVSMEFNREPGIPEDIREQMPEGMGGISVPIRADQAPIGVFVVNIFAPREVTEDEVNLLNTMAEIAGSAIRRAQLHQQTERNLDRLLSLSEVSRAINANLDLRITLESLVSQVVEQLDVDAADVMLLNEHLHILEFAAGRGFEIPGFGPGLTLRAGQGLAGLVLAQRKLIHKRNLPPEDFSEEFAEDIRREGFKTYVGVPLIAKGKLKGVLGIFKRADLDPDMEWLSFLSSLASQASIAIDNASLVEDLQRSNLDLELAYDATIEGWSQAMDLRDRETEGHSQRVTELAIRLARRVGVKDDYLVHLRRGALLHDIGKMGIPDDILHKPGPLDEAEWEKMRQHPVYARSMLQSVDYLQRALDIPYAHHEKWDGSGYPLGLTGDAIPMVARIFAVADVFDALTSDRPYRKAWSREKAIEYIREQSGQHFDPAVAEAFLAMV